MKKILSLLVVLMIGFVLVACGETEKFNVVFDTDGGTPQPITQEIEKGKFATEPTPAPTKVNHTFDGWYQGSTKFEFATKAIVENTTLKAHWTIIDEDVVTYDVTFDSDGGTLVSKLTVEEGEKATAPTTPTKAGYGFVAWFNGETEFDFNETEIQSNVSLKARWVEITADTIVLKVWGSAPERALFDELVTEYKASNSSKSYHFIWQTIGPDMARETYLNDPDNAADVFLFANDQILELHEVGGLLQIQGNVARDVQERNISGAVDAATVDGKLYAFPLTADNGYFMYYDKSVLNETDVLSLDSIFAKLPNGKQIYFPFATGWYASSLFLTMSDIVYEADGKLSYALDADGKQNLAQAALDIIKNPKLVAGSFDMVAGFNAGTIAAGVSGTWEADNVKAALGENYAATKLPTATIGGEQVQLSSFAGYKLIGVNAHTEELDEAVAFADFYTNEANQVKRITYTGLGFGPSNKNAQTNSALTENIALAALALQSQHAKPQGALPGEYWWTPVEAFGTEINSSSFTVAQILAKLEETIATINGN